MPEYCLNKECRECSFSMNQGGRLVCNWQNRLGIKKGDVSSFIGGESDEEKLKREAETKLEEAKGLERTLKKIEEIKEKRKQIAGEA